MKTMEHGGEIRKVSETESHILAASGWKFIPKKKNGIAFVCDKCGKKFRTRPDSCNGDIVETVKEGEKKHSTCGCKKFSQKSVQIPANWP